MGCITLKGKNKMNKEEIDILTGYPKKCPYLCNKTKICVAKWILCLLETKLKKFHYTWCQYYKDDYDSIKAEIIKNGVER